MTRCCFDMAIKAASAFSLLVASSSSTDFRRLQQLRIGASSSAAPSGVDLNTLQSAIAKKDSSAVKEALDQLVKLVVPRNGVLSHMSRGVPCLFAGPSYSGIFSRYWEEHVNLIDERLEKLIYSRQLDAKELDRLAVVAMAGFAAEGLKDDKVIGQSADLFTLQTYQQKQAAAQQNLTRWAALFAGSLLKNNKAIHEALVTAMSNKATVLECTEAIEKAA